MMFKFIALATTLALAGATSCYESAPFDCPEGTFCTAWNDGCNECGCQTADGIAFCTAMFCPCMEDNSCVPTCKDNNNQCTPKPVVNATADNTAATTDETATTEGTTSCYDAAPFDCPEGTVCTEWNDGCNECGCGAPEEVAFCTMMFCPCLEDNSCIPTCKDNDQCTPKKVATSGATTNATVAEQQPTAGGDTTCYEAAPFDCPEGTYCTKWNDGCNECSCGAGSDAAAACTLMTCPCYEDNSCVPTCNDNDQCVPIAPESMEETDEEEPLPTTGAPDAAQSGAIVLTSWLPALLVPFVLFM